MTSVGHAFEQPALDKPFQSIRAVLEAYKTSHPDKIALHDLDQDKAISWGQLHDWANRVARYLSDRGIRKGDRIGLLSDESVEKMILWMGIWPDPFLSVFDASVSNLLANYQSALSSVDPLNLAGR